MNTLIQDDRTFTELAKVNAGLRGNTRQHKRLEKEGYIENGQITQKGREYLAWPTKNGRDLKNTFHTIFINLKKNENRVAQLIRSTALSSGAGLENPERAVRITVANICEDLRNELGLNTAKNNAIQIHYIKQANTRKTSQKSKTEINID